MSTPPSSLGGVTPGVLLGLEGGVLDAEAVAKQTTDRGDGRIDRAGVGVET